MSGPVNGVDALVAVIVIVLLAYTLAYALWRRDDRERRSDRLIQRNLWRQTGGRL